MYMKHLTLSSALALCRKLDGILCCGSDIACLIVIWSINDRSTGR